MIMIQGAMQGNRARCHLDKPDETGAREANDEPVLGPWTNSTAQNWVSGLIDQARPGCYRSLKKAATGRLGDSQCRLRGK